MHGDRGQQREEDRAFPRRELGRAVLRFEDQESERPGDGHQPQAQRQPAEKRGERIALQTFGGAAGRFEMLERGRPQGLAVEAGVGLRRAHQLAFPQDQVEPRAKAPQRLQGPAGKGADFFGIGDHRVGKLTVILPRALPDLLRLLLGPQRLSLARPDLTVLRIPDALGKAGLGALGGTLDPGDPLFVGILDAGLLRLAGGDPAGLARRLFARDGLAARRGLAFRGQLAGGADAVQRGLAAGHRRDGRLQPAQLFADPFGVEGVSHSRHEFWQEPRRVLR